MKKPQATFAIFCLILSFAALWVRQGHSDAPAGQYTIMNGTVYDTKTKLTWQQTLSPMDYSWDDAQAYCAQLDLNGLGWRAPSIKELQTIVDDTIGAPSIDEKAFPGTPVDYFWSSTPLASAPTDAWFVVTAYGGAGHTSKGLSNRVRCVR